MDPNPSGIRAAVRRRRRVELASNRVPAAATPGYSGKPLADKLGIKTGKRIGAVRAPKELVAWLAPLPTDAKIVTARARAIDCAMLFVTRKAGLVREFKTQV